MQLTDRDRSLLASLSDQPAFVLLVGLFKEYESDVLASLSKTAGDQDLLRRSRFYQFLRSVREFLETRPEAALEELQQLQQQLAEEVDPGAMTPGRLWQQRFGQGPPDGAES